MSGDTTSRDSVAFADARSVSAVAIATRAVATWIDARSESDTIAVRARTWTFAIRCAESASASWIFPAASSSRADSAL